MVTDDGSITFSINNVLFLLPISPPVTVLQD